jgi:hypothetical protein
VDGPVHGGEETVAGGLGGGGDGRGGDGVQPGEVGHPELAGGEDRGDGVPPDPALHARVPPVALGRGGDPGEEGDGGDDALAVEVVGAHDPAVVVPEQAPADRPPVDAVHHQAVQEEGRVGLLHAVEDDLPRRVGDVPG